jgi:hypothetical protein
VRWIHPNIHGLTAGQFRQAEIPDLLPFEIESLAVGLDEMLRGVCNCWPAGMESAVRRCCRFRGSDMRPVVFGGVDREPAGVKLARATIFSSSPRQRDRGRQPSAPGRR